MKKPNLKKITKLREQIGGTDAIRNQEYQRLLDLPEGGRNLSVKSQIEIFDDAADTGLNFEKLLELRDFEFQLIDNFEICSSAIMDVIQSDGNLRILITLHNELHDLIDALMLSYIVVNNFEHYLERRSDLCSKVKEQLTTRGAIKTLWKLECSSV